MIGFYANIDILAPITMGRLNPSIGQNLSGKQSSIKDLDYYLKGILEERDYYVLSEAITLLESSHEEHRQRSLQVLSALYPHRTDAIRLGITGSPGVGKSTFIDGIAGHYAGSGHTVGILTVDPSSTSGQGSILGDKTRMENLVSHKGIFIRPSPSNRHLGGLNQYSYESMILCESAGIDTILLETVGVGQSEVEVSSYTDVMILLILPGSGDSIQGIKKGVLEKADLIVVHKADGDGLNLANQSIRHLQEALHLKKKNSTVPEVIAYSSYTYEGQEALLSAIQKVITQKKDSLSAIRNQQQNRWLKQRMKDELSYELGKLLDDSQAYQQLLKDPSQNIFETIQTFKEKIQIDLKI